MLHDYYVFIDADDSNKIKVKSGRTGAILSTHAKEANVPLQAAIDSLSYGSAIKENGTWSGGSYGTIYIGPGTFTFKNGIIYKSYLMFIGSGTNQTTFKWADNTLLGNHNQTMFRSSMWDINSTGGGVQTVAQLSKNDIFVVFRDLQIDGNWRKNIIPPVNTATTTGLGTISRPETAGTVSWGHGIAHYGGGLHVENCIIHSCPGAGLITQNYYSQLGTGYPYPLNPPANTGGTNAGLFFPLNYVRNVQCWGNGRQGILGRAGMYVENYWSYFNGEAGIDLQVSDYFSGGPSWIRGIECFLDGFNHGDQNSTTYDPLGFEIRILTGSWLSDVWIEAPYGCGDNLMIGSNGGLTNPTGYQIKTRPVGISLTNAVLDSMRANAIFIGNGQKGGSMRNVRVSSPNTGTPIQAGGVIPINMQGCLGWDIELAWDSFTDGIKHNGLTMGTDSPSVFNWGNNLRLFSYNNLYVLNNQNSQNYNVINATLINTTQGTKYFLQPGSVPLDYTINKINVESVGGTSRTRSHNGGVATFSGDGATAIFTIPHLCFDTPLVVSVFPQTQDARGNPIATADNTNITVTYPIAPQTGKNNIKLWWNARVTP